MGLVGPIYLKNFSLETLAKYGPKSFNNRFGRLSWDGIFNTIVTRITPYWGRVIHPEDERVLSVRECDAPKVSAMIVFFMEALQAVPVK